MHDLTWDSTSYDASSVIVRVQPGTELASLLVSVLPGSQVSCAVQLVPGLHKVDLPVGVTVADALGVLTTLDGVMYAQPDYSVSLGEALLPNDLGFSSMWGLHNTGQSGGTPDADIDAPEAWGVTTGSSSVIVAVIDSGVDYTHPDLAANIWINPGEIAGDGIDNDSNGFVDDVRGWDFLNNDNDPMDDNDHGTHIAGTIAAVGNNAIGMTGVAWGVKIMPIKISGPSGTSDLFMAMQGLEYAVSMGATVSNNSYVTTSTSSAFRDAITAAGQKGHVFVAAAGNEGSDNDVTPKNPGSFTMDNIITVAATDHNDVRPSWSNYGATSVDIGAGSQYLQHKARRWISVQERNFDGRSASGRGCRTGAECAARFHGTGSRGCHSG